MKFKNILFPLLIIFLGVVFSLYLQGQIPEGVYFSGDGGLKALLAQQLSRGQLHFDLVPPSASWIKDLWNDGLYPYEEPFVYQVNEKYFITFPYTFPLVTAPFLSLFGYRGLYLIPLVSTWIIWLVTYLACQRLKFKQISTSIVLIILIFSSYLTIYSAMYWEHTLAVALCFTGMALLTVFSYPQGLSTNQAILSGSLIGLAVWFRPEFLCAVVILGGIVLFASFSYYTQKTGLANFIPLEKIEFLAKKKEIFLVSMVGTVSLFFLINKLIYGHALGIHGIQVVEKISLLARLLAAWNNFQGMSLALFSYLPIIYFPLLYLIFYLFQRIWLSNKQKIEFNLPLIITYLACFAFVVGVSILVPVGTAGLIAGGKQWGSRFLLILVPIIALVTAIALENIQASKQPLAKYSSLIILVILIVLGSYKNLYQGTVFWQKNNQNTLPAVEFIQKDKNKIVAISHQFVGQALEPPVANKKSFFRVEDIEELIKLSQVLIQQNENQFTYVCYPNRLCTVPTTNLENLQFTINNKNYHLQINNLGKFGKYPFYQIEIIET